MSFFKGQSVKEVFGFEEDEIKAKLAKADHADVEIKALREHNTALETNAIEQRREMELIKNSLRALEMRGSSSGDERDEQPSRGIPSVTENEDAAFAHRLTPVIRMTMENTAETMLNKVSRKFSDWSKFKKDIDEILEKTPLEHRVYEQVIENAYYMAKGKNTDKIVQDTLAGKGEYFIEGAGGTGNPGANPTKTSEEQLSSEEKKMAASYGLTAEQWLEAKKGVKYV